MISEKEDDLLRYTHIFENVFLRNFRFICFSSSNCRNFRFNSLLFRNSTISLFSRNYPRKFPHHVSPFLKFRSFWLNGKSPKCEYRRQNITKNQSERRKNGRAQSAISIFFFQNGSDRAQIKARNIDGSDRWRTCRSGSIFSSLFSWRRRRRKKGKQHCRNCHKCLLLHFSQLCRYIDIHIIDEGRSCSYAVMLVCLYVASLKQCAINSLGLGFAVDFHWEDNPRKFFLSNYIPRNTLWNITIFYQRDLPKILKTKLPWLQFCPSLCHSTPQWRCVTEGTGNAVDGITAFAVRERGGCFICDEQFVSWYYHVCKLEAVVTCS